MNTIRFDDRYSARCTPFDTDEDDNRRRLRRLQYYLPQAMEELTQRQREMVQLRFYEDLSVSEIAQRLQVNPSTVSRCLSRAERRLHRVLRFSL